MKFGRSLVFGAVGSMLLATASNAATINMECKVAGYSSAGWIKIIPGSNTGGRVQKDASGVPYTDRVQRLEPLRITYTAKGTERCSGGYYGCILKFTGGFQSFAAFNQVPLPYTMVVTCPGDPAWDNVIAGISTSMGCFVSRVPIGTRPQ